MQRISDEKLTACPECDELFLLSLHDGLRLHCPNCDEPIARPSYRDLHHCMALVITALLLLIPSVSQPIISFHIAEFVTTSAIIEGVLKVWNNGYILMACAVMLTTIIIPAALCSLMLFTLIQVLSRRMHGVKTALHFYQHLREWALLEVYMLGLIVGYFKLQDFGSVELNLGLLSFVSLMMCIIAACRKFDLRLIWEMVERNENNDAG